MNVIVLDSVRPKPCSCGSWLKHWQKFSEQPLLSCPAIGCLRKDLVGVHGHEADHYSDRYFIFPLCQLHAQQVGPFDVHASLRLVPAEIEQTCGKKSNCESGKFLFLG